MMDYSSCILSLASGGEGGHERGGGEGSLREIENNVSRHFMRGKFRKALAFFITFFSKVSFVFNRGIPFFWLCFRNVSVATKTIQ